MALLVGACLSLPLFIVILGMWKTVLATSFFNSSIAHYLGVSGFVIGVCLSLPPFIVTLSMWKIVLATSFFILPMRLFAVKILKKCFVTGVFCQRRVVTALKIIRKTIDAPVNT